ncbi:MAG TPA: dTDP-4-dehydrorhamnose reductase [Chloroflexia bacterium]|nr:dTDP-4-dehydrorhamnose reductase [Chloroflexia bacterium]
MRIAIVGTRGTLGATLDRQTRAAGHAVTALNRPEHDMTDNAAIHRAIGEFGPDVVLHPAAYTDVDGAEREPAVAYAINGLGTRNVALACAAAGCALLYVSTNVVFDGTADRPYNEWHPRSPLGVYGKSKAAGEIYVEHLLQKFYIARVSWLYGRTGDHFVHKITKAADARGALNVVDDEIATPTYAEDMAAAMLQLVTRPQPAYGWYHFVNEGECSRFAYTQRIMELTGRGSVPLTPVSYRSFQRPAPVPPYSTLVNTVGAADGIRLRPWEEALADYIASAPVLQRPPAGGLDATTGGV